MRDIIVIHGFASSGNSIKSKFIKKEFGSAVKTPSLPSIPEKDIEILEKIIQDCSDPLLIGSSLGGFYSLYMSQKYNLDSILINPLLHIDDIKPYIGNHKYYDNDEIFSFKFDDYLFLKNIEKIIINNKKYNSKIYIIVSKNDKIIPFTKSLDFFYSANVNLKVYKNGNHSFNREKIVISWVKKALSNKENK